MNMVEHVLLFNDWKKDGLPSNFSEYFAFNISSINTSKLNYKMIFQSSLKNSVITFVTYFEIYLEDLIELLFNKIPEELIPELNEINSDKNQNERKRNEKIKQVISKHKNQLLGKGIKKKSKDEILSDFISIHLKRDLNVFKKPLMALKGLIETRNLLVHENTSSQISIEDEKGKIHAKHNINISLKRESIVRGIIYLIKFLNEIDSIARNKIDQIVK